MKRIFALIPAFALVLTLAGCKGSGQPTEPATVPTVPETLPETAPATIPETEPETLPETVPETEPETVPAGYTALTLADCVKTGYEQVGSYTDNVGNEFAYSYYLPEITLDCPGAAEINGAIHDQFVACAEEQLSYVEEGVSISVHRMDYTAALENGILSIMVQQDTLTDYTQYAVYNLDLATGEAASREAVLALFGMAEGEFTAAVQERAVSIYLDWYGDGSQLPEDAANFYDIQLEKTRTQNDNAPVFIGAEGRLSAVVNIYSLAGADYYPQTVEIP